MSCHHPMKAFWTGGYTDKGKKDYFVCSGTAGNYISAALVEKRGKRIFPGAPVAKFDGGPLLLKDPLSIPCGHCLGCRMDRARAWKVRLVHESLDYPDQSWFVTLTYRDESLPVNSEGQPYLKKRDIQLFLKRLRRYSGCKFRYYCCGEYGEGLGSSYRPHYHLILFGPLDDLIPFAFQRYHSSLIERCWPYGISEVSPAEPNCMAYVAGYVEKKQKDPDHFNHPVPPFAMMSRKPMLGYRYACSVDNSPDRKVYGNFGNAHYASIPSAYLRLHEDDEWFEDYKKRSEEIAKNLQLTQFAVFGCSNEEEIGDLLDDISVKEMEGKRVNKI